MAIEVSGQIQGYLYETKLDIRPTKGNTIVEVMNGRTPRCICPGSSHLTLALVSLGPLKAPRKSSTDTTQSDSLIADLEHQLGDTRTNFLEVGLSYCHSGFHRTRLKTTATGTVKRHNPASVWSSTQPVLSNDLGPIIETHWGAKRSQDIMQHIRKARKGFGNGKGATKKWNLSGWW